MPAWDFVLPSDLHQFPQTVQMEVIKILGLALINSPSLTGIQMYREDHSFVDLQLGRQAHSSAIPNR